ncbi:MAG: glycerol-3-phosphate dehydrogenase [Rhizobiaceae bacterium]
METTVADPQPEDRIYDLFIIGGGINGCGIARDAAGRGLTVCLAEKGDLASATSSASTKLFHGGLRYLEYFEVRLVREALMEREVLLSAMPHIARPMRFVLPLHESMRFEAETPASRLIALFMPWLKGRRPGWMIRLGLFIYDHLGRRKLLPGTSTLDLRHAPEGRPLKDSFRKAFEYSDCWVEDSRLVVLNARDAKDRGAVILTRTAAMAARREAGQWAVDIMDGETGARRTVRARVLINAGGPWVEDVIRDKARLDSPDRIRLVRGSHIVTRRLFDHDKCYFLQGADRRIVFAIPYETDFTLIGTTDMDHPGLDVEPECSPAEQDYLCAFASSYFRTPVTRADIVWTYSGVRPLQDDGADSASAATRDYTIRVDAAGGAPMLNIFGGKITTYRKLAESVMREARAFFPDLPGDWTAGIPLPGGSFPVDGTPMLEGALSNAYPFLDPRHVRRLVRAYGTDASALLGQARSPADLGRDFGATLSEREVRWLMEREFARTAEDVVWRRSKLGLRMTGPEIAALEAYMRGVGGIPAEPPERISAR